MRNLIIRAASGLVYITLIITLLFFGGHFGFPCLCAIVFATLAANEFLHIAENGRAADMITYFDRLAVILVAFIPLLVYFAGLPAGLAAVMAVVLLRLTLQLYSRNHSPEQRVATSLMTYIYISAPLAIASSLFLNHGPELVFVMFAMIWLNDTGAYLVGCTFGRHRLYERISPKKSWEGFFGGMVFAIAAGAIVSLYIPQLSSGLSLLQLCIMGFTVCIASTFGDLFESLLKRAAGVKDSGHLMPGHGGILDRIDSLLFVAPATWIIISLF